MTIELVEEENCSNIKKRLAGKKKKNHNINKKKLGWAIRLGEPIPKEDKRYSCKFYESDSRTCLEYKTRNCTICFRYKSKFITNVVQKDEKILCEIWRNNYEKY